MGLISEFISRTLSGEFTIGLGGFKLVNNGGIAEVKDSSDNLQILRAKAPVGNDDVATKQWAEANLGVANAVREYEVTVAFGDLTATGTAVIEGPELPQGAVIKSIDTDVATAFDGGVTLKAGLTGAAEQYVSAGELPMGTAGTYSKNQRSPKVASAETLKLTFDASGTPSQGSVTVFATFSIPSTPA